jgi:hypothetical protein
MQLFLELRGGDLGLAGGDADVGADRTMLGSWRCSPASSWILGETKEPISTVGRIVSW